MFMYSKYGYYINTIISFFYLNFRKIDNNNLFIKIYTSKIQIQTIQIITLQSS